MTLAALIQKKKDTKVAIAIPATFATSSRENKATVAKIATIAVADQLKTEKFRNLIAQLMIIYGGTQEEWIESAVDSINESHTIDSIKECWTNLIKENQSVLNRKNQEEVLI